jgi:hypothetical protein
VGPIPSLPSLGRFSHHLDGCPAYTGYVSAIVRSLESRTSARGQWGPAAVAKMLLSDGPECIVVATEWAGLVRDLAWSHDALRCLDSQAPCVQQQYVVPALAPARSFRQRVGGQP